MRCKRPVARRFTLLELMVVVFILAAVATTAASVVGEADDQARYEVTGSRLEQTRDAILGRADGRSGFAADMGRLPTSLDELLEQGALPSFAWVGGVRPRDPQLGAGWRGPYLELAPGAASGFSDGWANSPVAAPDWGWDLTLTPASGSGAPVEDFTLSSRGRDNAAGGTEPYDQDRALRLDRLSWQVDLAGWSVDVELVNPGSTVFDNAGDPVQLTLDVVINGAISQRLSEPQSIALNPGESVVLPFLFSAASLVSPDPASEDAQWVPAGRVRISLQSTGLGTPRVGPSPASLVELRAQAGRPIRLERAWRVQ